ncbi:MAG: hypothetical protein E7559_08850 [Ruminococcaceae bacterium]|nr:hypothetical protein [Oscillospiraceae bacterium]
MISKDMYRALKEIPRSTEKTTLPKLVEKRIMKTELLWDLIEEAINCNYISYSARNPHNDIYKMSFSLSELGQIEMEEYRRKVFSAVKSTLAVIISGISLIVSIVAIFVSSCGVQ